MPRGIPNKCKTLSEQLEGKYTINKETSCWEINTKYPYGRVKIRNGYKDYTVIGYHQLAYLVHKGEIPEGMWVLHTCHNNFCCNPNHLYLGTREQNEKDKVENGSIKGEKHPKSKLSEDDISDIRLLIGFQMSDISIAEYYPVKKAAISKIRHGRNWK